MLPLKTCKAMALYGPAQLIFGDPVKKLAPLLSKFLLVGPIYKTSYSYASSNVTLETCR